MPTKPHCTLAALVLALTPAATTAGTFNAYGVVNTIWPATDGSVYVRLRDTAGSNCSANSPYYFVISHTNPALVDRWLSLLEISHATGKRVWLQGNDAQCATPQHVRADYVLLVDG